MKCAQCAGYALVCCAGRRVRILAMQFKSTSGLQKRFFFSSILIDCREKGKAKPAMEEDKAKSDEGAYWIAVSGAQAPIRRAKKDVP